MTGDIHGGISPQLPVNHERAEEVCHSGRLVIVSSKVIVGSKVIVAQRS